MPYGSSSYQAEREGPLEPRSLCQPEQHSKTLCRDSNNFHTPEMAQQLRALAVLAVNLD